MCTQREIQKAKKSPHSVHKSRNYGFFALTFWATRKDSMSKFLAEQRQIQKTKSLKRLREQMKEVCRSTTEPEQRA